MKRIILIIPLLLSLFGAIAQQQRISGKVLDSETREPLIGASLLNQETGKGVTTDESGQFTIQADPGQTIRVSYLGFESLAYKVTSADNAVTIALKATASSLDAVLISTGYQSERKKDLTGAVAVVDVTDMKKQSVANPMKALQGQVAGVQITGNGSPSSPATVRIRGIGTLNNNDPLYIIDGVPTKAGMHELNQADIESMQILKDAASASIYGARAANGVIIITTKRGKKGMLQVNANAYSSLSNYTNRTEMLDGEGYGRALWQASINSSANPNNNSIQYRFDWQVDANGKPILNKVLIPQYLDASQTLRSANTDWFDEISQVGIVQNYDFSVSNGAENGNYLLSVGYFDNKGVIKTTGFDRLSARLNSDYRLFKGKLSVGQNLSFTKTDEVSTTPMNEAMQALPIIPVRTVDGSGWGGPIGGMNDRQNPVRILEDNKQNGYDYTRVFGNFFGDLSLLKGLKFRTNVGIDYGNFTARRWRKAYQSGYLNNPVNRLESSQSHNVRTTWSNTLNFNTEFKEHRFDAFGGTELNVENLNSFWASRESFVVEDPDFMYLGAGTGTKDNGGSGAKNVLLSYFGRVNYSFKDRYLVSGYLRYDGSSRFGENNRFGAFPAFSLGWRLSEESFIKDNIKIIDDLKLRYSWGKVGNQEIDNNAIHGLYVTDYNTTSYDINGNRSGVLPSGYKLIQNANSDLRWEATTQSNFGIDFSIFNRNLYGSAEYFTKETSDILVLPPYIGVLGEGGNRWVNGASMMNKGFELAIGHRSTLSNDLSFDVNLNFDRIRNQVTELPSEMVNAYGGDGRGQNILGRTLGSHFGYIADGLFKTQEQVDAHAAQQGKGLGRIRYRDLNNDQVINDFDRTWIGSPLPEFSYGFNANVNYKKFDFSFLLQGIGKVDVVNGFKYHTDFWSVSETGSNKGARLLNAWSPSNPSSDIPALTLTDNNWEGRFSTYYIENGSYLKLRNAQLGYSFDKASASKIGLQSLRLYIGGDNLGIISKSKSFTGVDPENPGFGYPNPRVITAGAQIRL